MASNFEDAGLTEEVIVYICDRESKLLKLFSLNRKKIIEGNSRFWIERRWARMGSFGRGGI